MSRISIRTLLALTSGGLVLVATVAVLWIALLANTRNTVELLNNRMVLILDGIESEVRDKLDTASAVVDGLSEEMRNGHFRAASPDEILDAMTVVLATSPEIGVLVYWDRSMTRRGVFRHDGDQFSRLAAAVEGDPRVRNRLAGLPAGSAHVWGEPINEGGETYLNVVARVDSQGGDIAFVGAAVSLNQFSRFVAGTGRAYGATAFILYGEKQLLAHPDFVTGGVGTAGRVVIPVSESTDPVIVNLDKATPVSFMQTARAQGVQVEQLAVGDDDYLVLYRWVEGYGAQPIAIGAYYAQTQFGDTLRRLTMSGIVGLGIAVLAVIAAIVLGGFIARPVRRLADAASAVARLDLGTATRPSGSAIAEIDQQAQAFNVMLDGLKVFETYVPRQLVQRLIALGTHEGVASETREVTVMFTDIVGFTAISERMGATETAEFLNRHFSMLADCVRAESGTIDKYIGDAVMAFWGAPDRMDDHAARAVATARRIMAMITADNARRARKGLKPIRLRVGLHSGPAVVGNIGAPGRVNYTIVGDTVNVAQRLESLGHKLDDGADVTVLMSATTARFAEVGSQGIDVGEHRLPGVPHEIAVVRLLPPEPEAVAGLATPAPEAAQ